jgi:hypothetical protein
MDGVRTFAVHELAMTAMVSAMKKTDSRKLILRALDQVVAPEGGEQAVILGIQGVLVEPLFPAGKGMVAGFPTDLPTDGIATEESGVAPIGDEFFQVVPHRGGPILVMADAQYEPVILEDFGTQFEIHV